MSSCSQEYKLQHLHGVIPGLAVPYNKTNQIWHIHKILIPMVAFCQCR